MSATLLRWFNKAIDKLLSVLDMRAERVALRHKSLEVGKEYRFPGTTGHASLRSTNPKIVFGSSTFRAVSDAVGSEARGSIERVGRLGRGTTVLPFTIVPWPCDVHRLDEINELGVVTILGFFEGRLLFCDEKFLYASRDGLQPWEQLAVLPARQRYRSDCPLILDTPVGYFLRLDSCVARSSNLKDWTVECELSCRGMFQGMDFLVVGEEVQIFVIEYSTDPAHAHSLYVGKYRNELCLSWERRFTFASSNDWRQSHLCFPVARHIHALAVDRESGVIWIATGDANHESGIWFSGDCGHSFKPFAVGSQRFRTLAIWFVDKHMYWSMDTHKEDQRVFRVLRPRSAEEAEMQAVSQMHGPGAQLEKDKRYLVIANAGEEAGRPGKGYRPTMSRTVGQDEIFIEVVRGKNFLPEVVAELPYGTQWYVGPVMHEGKERFLLSASPESQVPSTGEVPHRDWNCRLFLFTLSDLGSVQYDEVHCGMPNPDVTEPKSLRYNRIDFRCQDQDGNLYFMSHNNEYKGALCARLVSVQE